MVQAGKSEIGVLKKESPSNKNKLTSYIDNALPIMPAKTWIQNPSRNGH